MFYKRVKFLHSVVVNANGNAIIGGSVFALPNFESGSASPILAVNDASYDPYSTTNGATTGWLTTIVGSTGLNLDTNIHTRAYVQSAHLKFRLTGVSNYEKKGTIHMFEDVDKSIRYGTSAADATYLKAFLN